MGKKLDRIKALASFPLAMYAGVEAAVPPEQLGAGMAEAVMGIPKVAEHIGEFETKALDSLRPRHAAGPDRSSPQRAAPERSGPGLIPDAPEVAPPEHPELEF